MEISDIPREYRFDASDEQYREAQTGDALYPFEDDRGPLKCAACGLLITDQDAAIAMAGGHAHRFSNPSGFSFHIGCFNHAPGCIPFGLQCEEYSWFPGYAWTVAVCAACGTHIGWRFRGPSDHFYGLILDRLASNSTE